MSLYFGNMLVAGRGPHVIICTSEKDYQNKLSSWGGDAFYYVPPGVKVAKDMKGLHFSIANQDDSEGQQAQEGESGQARRRAAAITLVCVSSDSDLWSGLEYTYDGETWNMFKELDTPDQNTISINTENPDVYIRAVDGGNKAFFGRNGAFSRRLVIQSDADKDPEHGIEDPTLVAIDGDYLLLLSNDYDTNLSNGFTYGGVSCVFMSAFAGSTGLVHASELPSPSKPDVSTLNLSALSATPSCYMGMFEGCVNLTEAPKICDPLLYAISGEGDNRTYISVEGSAPPADTYSRIFKGCSMVNSVIGEFTRWFYEENDSVSCFTEWMSGVSAYGIVQLPSALTAIDNQMKKAYDYGLLPLLSYWQVSSIEDVQAAADIGGEDEDEEDE